MTDKSIENYKDLLVSIFNLKNSNSLFESLVHPTYLDKELIISKLLLYNSLNSLSSLQYILKSHL